MKGINDRPSMDMRFCCMEYCCCLFVLESVFSSARGIRCAHRAEGFLYEFPNTERTFAKWYIVCFYFEIIDGYPQNILYHFKVIGFYDM